MKVTIIERQVFAEKHLLSSLERVFYPDNMDQLANIPIGHMAKRIRLECEFDKKDIPKLMQFLENSELSFYE
jgi:hypothetical protein